MNTVHAEGLAASANSAFMYGIGAVQYELIAANAAASAAGIPALLLVPLTPLLSSPVLAPAFANVISALFGALGYMFISQNWKIAVLPLIFVAALYTLLPAQTAQTVSGALIPVSVLVTVAGARILYKRNMV